MAGRRIPSGSTHGACSGRMRSASSAAYLVPSLALLGLVLLSPVAYAVWFSLHDIEYGAAMGFVGLANFGTLLDDPGLRPMLGRTLVFTAGSVALAVCVALALACWIDRLRGRLAVTVQMLAILPWIISAVVATLLFRWVFVHDLGLGFAALRSLGATPVQPLNNPSGAMALLIVVSAWKRVGYAVIVLLAGLKGIPAELSEAARIDGAGPWQLFVSVT